MNSNYIRCNKCNSLYYGTKDPLCYHCQMQEEAEGEDKLVTIKRVKKARRKPSISLKVLPNMHEYRKMCRMSEERNYA